MENRTKANETERLTGKQQRALAFLVTERTIEAAARKAGIGRTTIFEWFQDADFQAAYRVARGDLVRHAVAQAQAACSEAVTVLREIMINGENPAGTRVSAAKAVLETAIKAVEVEEVVARIERIEAYLGGKRPN